MIQIGEPTESELMTEMPGEVAVGDEIPLQVAVRCELGGDLRGAQIQVVRLPEHDTLATANLMAYASPTSETNMISVRAPSTVGRHNWLILFPEQEIDGRVLAESSRQISFDARPQKTSLAVWEVPSPVLVGARFQIKAGAKSAGGHSLGGTRLEVRDEAGTLLSEGTVSDQPWPGTTALYWTDFDLTAPDAEGPVAWSITFAGSQADLPHEDSSARFTFATVRPPNTTLLIRLFETESGEAIADANVRLGVFRGSTDTVGAATLKVPDGTYALTAWKAGYESASHQLDLTQDRELEINLVRLPKKKEYWL